MVTLVVLLTKLTSLHSPYATLNPLKPLPNRRHRAMSDMLTRDLTRVRASEASSHMRQTRMAHGALRLVPKGGGRLRPILRLSVGCRVAHERGYKARV